MKQKVRRKMIKSLQGFTLIEMVVVIIVVGILAAAVLTGSRALLHQQRFSGAAEQLRVMIQQARNRSQTQTDTVKTFGVHMPAVPGNGALIPDKIVFFEPQNVAATSFTPTDRVIDSLPLNVKEFSLSIKKELNGGFVPCNVDSLILFTTNNPNATLVCDGVTNNVNLLQIQMQSEQNPAYLRSFLINKVSGTLQ